MPAESTSQTAVETSSERASQFSKERVLLEWVAPSRPFKRRGKDFYTTLVGIAALMGLVLFLVEGFMPVLLIISLLFLFYVMSTVEPENVTYQVTNLGLKVGGSLTDWERMGRFWFTKRLGSELLVVETFQLPGRLEIMIDSKVKSKIKDEVSEHLRHEEIPPSLIDKLSIRLSRLLPE